ncbi:hypothetical protein [[Eubacterium] hominis]|uniref:hypothetical protein n=1 Tax=[Eubacterium] hominis TaxID=2764325 RepID=UPI00206376B4|nr:MAG TPA: hypothetical protein [Caudoviricetes sp.]
MKLYINGQYEFFKSYQEIAEHVRQNISDDLGELIQELIKQTDVAYHKAQTDCECFEAECESYRNGFLEVKEECDALEDELCKQRINRTSISKICGNLKKICRNAL